MIWSTMSLFIVPSYVVLYIHYNLFFLLSIILTLVKVRYLLKLLYRFSLNYTIYKYIEIIQDYGNAREADASKNLLITRAKL